MSETTVIDQWLEDLLMNDAGIIAAFDAGDWPVQVYDSLAPAGIDYPWILFDNPTTLDTNGIGPNARVLVTSTYRIRAVARVSSYRAPVLTSIAAAIDTAVQAGPWADVLGVRRESEYRSAEEAEGRPIRHLGGNYTVWAQAL